MTAPYRVLILGDHAWRDTPGLALLSVELERQSAGAVDPLVVSFDLYREALQLFAPHLVLINHLRGRRNRELSQSVKASGGLCAVVPTEGRWETWDELRWDGRTCPEESCDLMLCWSEVAASHMPRGLITVAPGAPRFDFYHPPLRRCIRPRAEICRQYHLDPVRPIVTVASAYPTAKFAAAAGEFHQRDWRDLQLTELARKKDPRAWAAAERAALMRLHSGLHAVGMATPVQLLIKPHPAEDVRPWVQFCRGTGARLMVTDFIWNLLSVSDCHIARHECMTLPEAWLMGTKTLALVDRPVESGAGEEALAFADSVVDQAGQLGTAVGDLLASAEPAADPAPYLRRWFGPGAGASSRAAAALLDLLRRVEPRRDRTPGPADRVHLLRLLQAHSDAHRQPTADAIGQFGKPVRWAEVQRWKLRIQAAAEVCARRSKRGGARAGRLVSSSSA